MPKLLRCRVYPTNTTANTSVCELVLYKDNESLEGGVDILCNSKYSEEEDIYHFEMAHKYVKKGEKPK